MDNFTTETEESSLSSHKSNSRHAKQEKLVIDVAEMELPRSRRRRLDTFPWRLHSLLDNCDDSRFPQQHHISWQPHGRCFTIKDTLAFERNIMPVIFNQTKSSSFQRQLNIYGFHRISHGLDKGGYWHEYFLRGKPELLEKVERIKIKGTKVRAATNPDSEPNFYMMTTMPPVSANSSIIAAPSELLSNDTSNSMKPMTMNAIGPITEGAFHHAPLCKVTLTLPHQKAALSDFACMHHVGYTVNDIFNPLEEPESDIDHKELLCKPLIEIEAYSEMSDSDSSSIGRGYNLESQEKVICGSPRVHSNSLWNGNRNSADPICLPHLISGRSSPLKAPIMSFPIRENDAWGHLFDEMYPNK